MSFSAAIRKARELGGRSLALTRGPCGMVVPQAVYPARPHDGVLILGRGENPSIDYYLRPRLAGEAGPVEVAEVREGPGRSRLLADSRYGSLLVIVCRYASSEWLRALQAARPRITRLAFFADDDMPAMAADRSLPLAVRGKVAEGYARHVGRLGELSGEVWLSTDVLARRYPLSRAVVLPPLPEAAAPPPTGGDERLIVYHGTDVHGPERAFAVEVARRLRQAGCDAPMEITGDEALAATCRGIDHVTVTPQLPWPAYLQLNSRRRAALFLAPLCATAVNEARAPVKAFDAARMGATGLFADRAPYRGFVQDGVTGRLLSDDPQAWADAAAELLRDPAPRLAMGEAAAQRLRILRQTGAGLPPRPST